MPMSPRAKQAYQDDQLVELIGLGRDSYEAIGRQLGLSGSFVGKVARGERRPELAVRLRAMERGMMDEVRRLGVRYSRALLAAELRVALEGKGETARRAREFTLKFLLSARPPEAEGSGMPPVWSAPNLLDLSEETLAKVAEELGGPDNPDSSGAECLAEPNTPAKPAGK